MKKEERLLRVGVLGCGPISQFAHFDACRKARNAELYAICDRAEDLVTRMAAVHQPTKTYREFDAMLADPKVDAVIVAAADQFHVALCEKAIQAGKPVLVEKPLGVSIEECERLAALVSKSKTLLQVGNMKRFDPGIVFARQFIREEMGQMLAFKAWYCDSTYRYAMTDNLQPIPVTSANAQKPSGNPKADKRRYFMLTHGSHLVDTARFLGGEITAVRARLAEKFGAYSWFVDVDFADGSVGLLDLTIAVRMDFHEGFQIYGEHGSVIGKTYLPWFFKSSDVECFSTKDGQYHRPLGEDAHFYKLQVEGFADAILKKQPVQGATVADGVAAMRAMVAIARSVETGERVRLADATRERVMEIGIFAKTFARPTLAANLDAVVSHGLHCVQFNLACAGLPSLPERIDGADQIRHELEARQIKMVAVSGTFNMIHPDLAKRRDGMNRLRVLAASCRSLGTSVITLCTGTRDPANMWRRHPENDSAESWRDLVASMKEAVSIAEEHNVTLAFEPEVSNVIDTAQKGRRLLDEVGSPRVKVVLDAANLFHTGELPRMREILDEAFALLGHDIILAHAKDLRNDGDAGHEVAGTGLLDYDAYLAGLKKVGFDGALILHGLTENQVDKSVAFLRGKLGGS